MIEVIYTCVDDLNSQRGPQEQIAKSPQTILQGPDSALDSLGLILLAVSFEDAFAREFGVRVPLVSDLASFEGPSSPLASIDALASWVEQLSSDGT